MERFHQMDAAVTSGAKKSPPSQTPLLRQVPHHLLFLTAFPMILTAHAPAQINLKAHQSNSILVIHHLFVTGNHVEKWIFSAANSEFEGQTCCIKRKSAQHLLMQLSSLSCTPFRQRQCSIPGEAAKKWRVKNLVRDRQLRENQSIAVSSESEGCDSELWWGCKKIILRNNLLPLMLPGDWRHHHLTFRKKNNNKKKFVPHYKHPPILSQIVVF